MFNMRADKDIFVAILELGREKELDVVTYQDIYNLALREKYITQEEYDKIGLGSRLPQEIQTKKIILDKIFENNFLTVHAQNRHMGRTLSTDSYFKLIEYTELKEARKASESARKFSSWAIGISIGAIIISSVFAFVQLNSSVEINNPVELNQDQIDHIINSIKEAPSANQNITQP